MRAASGMPARPQPYCPLAGALLPSLDPSFVVSLGAFPMSATISVRHQGFRSVAPSAPVPSTAWFWWYWNN
jgi:hypothetical protein